LRAYVPGRSFAVILGIDGTFEMDNVPNGNYSVVIASGTTQLGATATVAVGNILADFGTVHVTCP
jgi:hypothetical protein